MINQAEQKHSIEEENLPQLPWHEKLFIGFMYLGALYGQGNVNVDKVIHERRLELAEKAKEQAAANQAHIEGLEILAEDGYDPIAQVAAQAELDRLKGKK